MHLSTYLLYYSYTYFIVSCFVLKSFLRFVYVCVVSSAFFGPRPIVFVIANYTCTLQYMSEMKQIINKSSNK